MRHRLALREHRLADRLVLAHLAGAPELDAAHDPRPVARDRAVDALAVVRDRRVRAGHVERVDGDRAEADREVRGQLRPDPELARSVDDRLRADDLRQLGVDRVVGRDHRPGEVDLAQVRPLVVRHLPDAVAGVDLDRLRGEARRRRDPLPEGAREHDRLERRARLALGLGREVELAPPEVRSAEHRLHAARPRVDRDERGRRAVRILRDTFSIASRACSWSSRSSVVVTSSPPPKTRFGSPYWSTSWSVT